MTTLQIHLYTIHTFASCPQKKNEDECTFGDHDLVLLLYSIILFQHLVSINKTLIIKMFWINMTKLNVFRTHKKQQESASKLDTHYISLNAPNGCFYINLLICFGIFIFIFGFFWSALWQRTAPKKDQTTWPMIWSHTCLFENYCRWLNSFFLRFRAPIRLYIYLEKIIQATSISTKTL